jgi:glycosyltransferase involved in cell wall biosynthesis
MTAGLVSVVIPCHNYGRFLSQAIESVLSQTYAPIEVVVVDDGSTDNTVEVAQQYPVTLLSEGQAGVCAAVNRGVRSSRGEFIIRLDADDVLDPRYVERMVAALAEDPRAALAYSHGCYFGSASGPFLLEPFDPDRLAEGAYVTCLALTRRAAFDSVGGYDESMADLRCEDWDLWLSFAERGIRGTLVRSQLWGYRRHARPSRNTWDLVSLRGIRRELTLIGRLQDKHPTLFTTSALLRRLRSVPTRLVRRQLPPRQAILLAVFCGIMLVRGHTQR